MLRVFRNEMEDPDQFVITLELVPGSESRGRSVDKVLHIAEEDEYVNKEAQAKILNAIEGKENITAQIYEGQDHAFARYNGMHYNEQAANLANTRTKAFFATHLS